MVTEIPKNRVLLTGAGFTANWGGLLASDITTDILAEINNAPHTIITTEYYRQLDTGNYETILEEFQNLHSADPEDKTKLECLIYIEEAIQNCFVTVQSPFLDEAFFF